MRLGVLKLVNYYAVSIISNYYAIKKANNLSSPLKLISVSKKKSRDYCFKIQVTGKNIFPELSIKEIKNTEVFNNFSAYDQRIIFSYLPFNEKNNNITKKITARTYDRARKGFIYSVEYYDQVLNIKKHLNFDNISLLLKDIDGFDKEDSCLIRQESKIN